MDSMRAAVDAAAMLECGISGGIVAENLDAQLGPCLKEDTAGQHLDLHRQDLAGLDRLALPMGVPRTAWSAALGVKFAVGHAQPPLGDPIVGEAVISIEEDLLTYRIELAKQDEEVQVVAFRGGDPQRERHGAGEFGRVLEVVDKARLIMRTAARIVLDYSLIGRCFGRKPPGHSIQIERDIRHLRQRPGRSFAYIAYRACASHSQPHAWRRLPPIRLALQEVVEEATLHLTRCGGVEGLPFAATVSVEPLLG